MRIWITWAISLIIATALVGGAGMVANNASLNKVYHTVDLSKVKSN